MLTVELVHRGAARHARRTAARMAEAWAVSREPERSGVLNRPGFCGGSQSTGEWDDGSSTEVSGLSLIHI